MKDLQKDTSSTAYDLMFTLDSYSRLFSEKEYRQKSEKLLSENEQRLNECNEQGQTLLHIAIKENKAKLVQLLLTRPAVNINIVDKNGYTPLALAAEYGNTDIAKKLLDLKAHIYSNEEIVNPMQVAMLSNHEKLAEMIISRDDLNIQKLEKKAKVSQENSEKTDPLKQQNHLGQSQLHLAILERNNDKVILLIQQGINVNLVDHQQRTALHYAVGVGSEKYVKFLIDNSAKINMVDKNKQSPLHYAFLLGHKTIGKLLLKHGASMHQQDKAGKSPYKYLTLPRPKNVKRESSQQPEKKSYQFNNAASLFKKTVSPKKIASPKKEPVVTTRNTGTSYNP